MNSALPDQEKAFKTALAMDDDDRPAEALKVLKPLVQPRDNPRYLVAYAHCLVRADGDWKEAVACLREALAIRTYVL
jgi:tetratricopeptide (TPR) repeat protein